ncbi:NEP1-interacting protein 1 [Glycine soja]|nr:NEP1-interacting protein 1 [Glycine max]
MDFALNPCPLRSSTFVNFVERVKQLGTLAFSAVIGNIFSAILTFCFALVGTLLGALTGALIGQETESGFIRGAAVGAISGAVFSIEVFESSLVLWQSDESGIGCVLYLIDVIASLLSGRLVRERIGPAMLSAVQSQVICFANLHLASKLSLAICLEFAHELPLLADNSALAYQMGAVEASFDEVQNIFDTGGSKGLSGDLVEKIPKIKITTDNNFDASGDRVSCSVCLQDFMLGETVRSLPHCHHMFHLPCIDKWLFRHGSCPLCRRDL